MDRYLPDINLRIIPTYSPILKIFKKSPLVYNRGSRKYAKSQRIGQRTTSSSPIESSFMKIIGSTVGIQIHSQILEFEIHPSPWECKYHLRL
jgi:hypothetical protein